MKFPILPVDPAQLARGRGWLVTSSSCARMERIWFWMRAAESLLVSTLRTDRTHRTYHLNKTISGTPNAAPVACGAPGRAPPEVLPHMFRAFDACRSLFTYPCSTRFLARARSEFSSGRGGCGGFYTLPPNLRLPRPSFGYNAGYFAGFKSRNFSQTREITQKDFSKAQVSQCGARILEGENNDRGN